jgi:hypothetical protein
MKVKHAALFARTSATFKDNIITTWEAMLVAWEKDMSKPDPYSEVETGEQLIVCYVLPNKLTSTKEHQWLMSTLSSQRKK